MAEKKAHAINALLFVHQQKKALRHRGTGKRQIYHRTCYSNELSTRTISQTLLGEPGTRTTTRVDDKREKMTVRTQQQDGGMGNSKSSAGNLVSLVVWLGYNLPVMKAVGRALRRIPPTPTYTVNRALGRWTDPGPMSAFATRDPIHIVHSTLRINPNMYMYMYMYMYNQR